MNISKKKFIFFLSALIFISIISCYSGETNKKKEVNDYESKSIEKDEDYYASNVKKDWDEFKKTGDYSCEPIEILGNDNKQVIATLASDLEHSYFLITFAFISDTGDGFKFYSEAYNTNGEKLDIISVDRDHSCNGHSGCYLIEYCNIVMSEEKIKELYNSNRLIKFYGKEGSRILEIQDFYIKGCLRGMGVIL